MRIITKNATDQSVTLHIVDNTTKLPATGLAYNSSGIDLWYRREGAAVVSITEATQTASGAHADGGFVHLANGVYRLDLPDAAVASGANHVTVGGTLTGYMVTPVTIQLSAFDMQTAWQGQYTQPRMNRKPDPGFTLQVSRRSDGTYKCTKPVRLTSGTIESVYVFIDMSPLFGPDNYVETVGDATTDGTVDQGTDNGPRDTFAVVELDGTADACTLTVPVTMTSGTTVDVSFDVEVLE